MTSGIVGSIEPLVWIVLGESHVSKVLLPMMIALYNLQLFYISEYLDTFCLI